MNKNIRAYFNSVAKNYNNSSQQGVWHFIRSNEKKKILNFLINKNFNNILELGSGSGYYTNFLIKHTKNTVTCVDFSNEMLKKLDLPRILKINADIEKFCNNKKYDLIFCAGVIEFVKNPSSVFTNANQMLSEDGVLIIFVPKKSFLGMFYKMFHNFNKIDVILFSKKNIFSYTQINNLSIINTSNVFPFGLCFLIQRNKEFL